MDKLLPGAIVIAFLIVLIVLMWRGWARRSRSGAKLGTPQTVPADAGSALVESPAFYVATTVGGEPLTRLAIPGLGFRARAVLSVSTGGIAIEIPGERAVYVPVADIAGLAPATWTIDRVVETDGLLMLAWRLNGTTVDSYFRVTDAAERRRLVHAIEDIAPTASVRATESEEHHGV